MAAEERVETIFGGAGVAWSIGRLSDATMLTLYRLWLSLVCYLCSVIVDGLKCCVGDHLCVSSGHDGFDTDCHCDVAAKFVVATHL